MAPLAGQVPKKHRFPTGAAQNRDPRIFGDLTKMPQVFRNPAAALHYKTLLRRQFFNFKGPGSSFLGSISGRFAAL